MAFQLRNPPTVFSQPNIPGVLQGAGEPAPTQSPCTEVGPGEVKTGEWTGHVQAAHLCLLGGQCPGTATWASGVDSGAQIGPLQISTATRWRLPIPRGQARCGGISSGPEPCRSRTTQGQDGGMNCTCMYVCIAVCTYKYIYLHTHTRINKYIYIHTYVWFPYSFLGSNLKETSRKHFYPPQDKVTRVSPVSNEQALGSWQA